MAASKKKPDQGDSSKSNFGEVAGTGPVEPQANRDDAGATQETPGSDSEAWNSPNSGWHPGFAGTGRKSDYEDSLLSGMDLAETLSLRSNLDQTPPVGNGTGVNSLLHDHQLLDQVLTAMVMNRTMDTLADDLAERLRYGLERSPQIRQRLIDAVMSNEAARERFIKLVVKSLV